MSWLSHSWLLNCSDTQQLSGANVDVNAGWITGHPYEGLDVKWCTIRASKSVCRGGWGGEQSKRVVDLDPGKWSWCSMWSQKLIQTMTMTFCHSHSLTKFVIVFVICLFVCPRLWRIHTGKALKWIKLPLLCVQVKHPMRLLYTLDLFWQFSLFMEVVFWHLIFTDKCEKNLFFFFFPGLDQICMLYYVYWI